MPRVPPVTIATRAIDPLLSFFLEGLCVGEPACKFAADQRVEQIHPLGAVVEAFEQGEMLAAGVDERGPPADAELFQRLQAVGGKAGRGNGNAPKALPRISGEDLIG